MYSLTVRCWGPQPLSFETQDQVQEAVVSCDCIRREEVMQDPSVEVEAASDRRAEPMEDMEEVVEVNLSNAHHVLGCPQENTICVSIIYELVVEIVCFGCSLPRGLGRRKSEVDEGSREILC